MLGKMCRPDEAELLRIYRALDGEKRDIARRLVRELGRT
jgi:hypothetical protein